MGVSAILVMWLQPFEQTHSRVLNSLCMKYEFNLPSGFRDVWKCWRTDDGVTILLAHPAFGSGEQKTTPTAGENIDPYE